MHDGERLEEPQSAGVIRARVLDTHGRLPQGLRRLRGAEPYEVKVAPALRDLAAQVDARTGGAG